MRVWFGRICPRNSPSKERFVWTSGSSGSAYLTPTYKSLLGNQAIRWSQDRRVSSIRQRGFPWSSYCQRSLLSIPTMTSQWKGGAWSGLFGSLLSFYRNFPAKGLKSVPNTHTHKKHFLPWQEWKWMWRVERETYHSIQGYLVQHSSCPFSPYYHLIYSLFFLKGAGGGFPFSGKRVNGRQSSDPFEKCCIVILTLPYLGESQDIL